MRNNLLQALLTMIAMLPLGAHAAEVELVKFSTVDGRLLAITRGKGEVLVLEGENTTTIWSFVQASQRDVTSLSFSRAGSLLAVGFADGSLKLFESRSGELIRDFASRRNPVTALAFSPDDRLLLGTESGTSLLQWTVEDGQLARSFGVMVGGTNRIGMSTDGELIYCSGMMAIEIFRADNGKLVGRYQDPGLAGEISNNANGFINGLILDVQYSADLRFAAMAMFNRVVLLSLENGKEIARFRAENAVFNRVRLSPDFERIFAFNAANGEVMGWSIHSKEELGKFAVSDWAQPNSEGGYTINFEQGESPVDFAADGALLAFRAAKDPFRIKLVPLKFPN